jgi:hypothetical protein
MITQLEDRNKKIKKESMKRDLGQRLATLCCGKCIGGVAMLWWQNCGQCRHVQYKYNVKMKVDDDYLITPIRT